MWWLVALLFLLCFSALDVIVKSAAFSGGSSSTEAIDWAKKQAHSPLVARVRHLNDKKKPDHWRSA
jgi:hypothetical protein